MVYEERGMIMNLLKVHEEIKEIFLFMDTRKLAMDEKIAVLDATSALLKSVVSTEAFQAMVVKAITKEF
jgi:hypothetical protein